MNKHFKRAHNAEIKLSHRQKRLSSTYHTLNSASKTLAREELFQAFHLFLLEQIIAFAAKLQHLISEIQISKSFHLAFQLLNSPMYWE